MNQDFKLRFDQMRNNNPTKPEPEKPTEQEDKVAGVHGYGNVRNLCLVWPDGRQTFFNYAYLIRADFHPGDEFNTIHLGFSGQDITIKGYGLEALFAQLVDHLPQTITAIDPRYIPVETANEIIVAGISLDAS
ncbi:hypothetical protein LXM25_05705 [Dyadobacter sp. LJ53]|uniref:hypothetical protein n=1 Tax=Dyadobacter chenwenxiniae TaxID=2906456 RepID=UPI001F348D86|nr:hypothetical protein [Dyadobacter chenwenxiniae]MCF0049538.1 hypothetical protein [Dyadobacter chenwenxiniae]